MSMTEVIRRAIELYDVVSKEQEKGKELLIRDKSGEVSRVIFF